MPVVQVRASYIVYSPPFRFLLRFVRKWLILLFLLDVRSVFLPRIFRYIALIGRPHRAALVTDWWDHLFVLANRNCERGKLR